MPYNLSHIVNKEKKRQIGYTSHEDAIIAEEYQRGRDYAARAAERILAETGLRRTARSVTSRASRISVTDKGRTEAEDIIIAEECRKGGRWVREAQSRLRREIGVERTAAQVLCRRQYIATAYQLPTRGYKNGNGSPWSAAEEQIVREEYIRSSRYMPRASRRIQIALGIERTEGAILTRAMTMLRKGKMPKRKDARFAPHNQRRESARGE